VLVDVNVFEEPLPNLTELLPLVEERFEQFLSEPEFLLKLEFLSSEEHVLVLLPILSGL